MSASTRSSGVPKRWQRTAFMGQESLEIVSEAHSGGGTARRGMPYDSRAMYIIAPGQLGRFAFTLPNSASSSRYSRFAAWRAGTLPGGRPMSAIRYAVLILVTSLASVAFAQQPPKPAASHAPPAVRRLGRVYRLARRQQGLLCPRQAEDDENGTGRPPARSVLPVRLDPPRRESKK